jgi:hypothetical protein
VGAQHGADALGGGAFTWNRIQQLYDADSGVHWHLLGE